MLRWRKQTHAGKIAWVRGGVFKLKKSEVPLPALEFYLKYLEIRELKKELEKC